MVDISVLDKISFKDIDIKSFRLSCQSDVWTEGLDYIGVMFLKCPEGAKTLLNRNLKSGYIHIKSVEELNERSKSKSLHQKCFKTLSNGNLNDFLVLGFSINNGLDSLILKSPTFNKKLSKYFNDDCDREGMQFFTPVLQTVIKKYRLEKVVGFTLNIEYIPLNACLMYKDIYPNVKFEERKIHFETKNDFYEWCRHFYKSDDIFDEVFFDLSFYTENSDFEQLEKWMRDKTAHNINLRTVATAVEAPTSTFFLSVKNFFWKW